jgi:hypothetical protein
MGQAHGGVRGTVVVSRAELGGWKDVEGIGVVKKVTRHNPLQKLAAALQQRDWTIGGRCRVVSLARLGQGDDTGMLPWVNAEGDGGIEQVNEPLGCHPKGPFDQFTG